MLRAQIPPKFFGNVTGFESLEGRIQFVQVKEAGGGEGPVTAVTIGVSTMIVPVTRNTAETMTPVLYFLIPDRLVVTSTEQLFRDQALKTHQITTGDLRFGSTKRGIGPMRLRQGDLTLTSVRNNPTTETLSVDVYDIL